MPTKQAKKEAKRQSKPQQTPPEQVNVKEIQPDSVSFIPVETQAKIASLLKHKAIADGVKSETIALLRLVAGVTARHAWYKSYADNYFAAHKTTDGMPDMKAWLIDELKRLGMKPGYAKTCVSQIATIEYYQERELDELLVDMSRLQLFTRKAVKESYRKIKEHKAKFISCDTPAETKALLVTLNILEVKETPAEKLEKLEKKIKLLIAEREALRGDLEERNKVLQEEVNRLKDELLATIRKEPVTV